MVDEIPASVAPEPRACLLLLGGLPGCGKTSFCKALLTRHSSNLEKKLAADSPGQLEVLAERIDNSTPVPTNPVQSIIELPAESGTKEEDASTLFHQAFHSSSIGAPMLAEWHHICYDEIEAELRETRGNFEPATWKAARERAAEIVSQRIASARAAAKEAAESSGNSGHACLIFLLDDNMYYRSMRKQWYRFAREQQCVFRQVLLAVPREACLARNRLRNAASQVPEFSINHMADVFEWPRDSWEAAEPISTVIDAADPSTEQQVVDFMQRWVGDGPCAGRFWEPLPPEELLEPGTSEVQSDAHLCDVALRKLVSEALANAPRELGKQKSVLAKRWGARKAELVKQFSAEMKLSSSPQQRSEDVIHDMEGVFLRLCVLDIQQHIAGQAP